MRVSWLLLLGVFVRMCLLSGCLRLFMVIFVVMMLWFVICSGLMGSGYVLRVLICFVCLGCGLLLVWMLLIL